MLEGQVVSGGDQAVRAAPQRLGNRPRGEESSQAPESSFGYKSFQGGRRTERRFISTHLVEAGWVPGGGAKLGNEPHGQRQRTDAGSSAERITYTDPYINLDLKVENLKILKVVLLLLSN